MNKRCIICDKEFDARVNQISCSKYCSKIRDKQKQKMNPNRQYKAKIKTCVVCGIEFVRKGTNAITCGQRCAKINNDRKNRLYSEKVRGKYPKKLGDKRKCVICGDMFRRKAAKQKTCSRDCSKINRLEVRRLLYPKYKPNPKFSHCFICGKKFKKITNKKTCSYDCSRIPISMSNYEYRLRNNDRLHKEENEKKQAQQFFNALAIAGSVPRE